VRVVALEQNADHVEVTIVSEIVETERFRTKYLIGTDGGRSAVRHLADIAFEGFTGPSGSSRLQLHSISKFLGEVTARATTSLIPMNGLTFSR
jgi:2-polyprenyl-6-methoxyphenol hydroxylase-like FAD-dependent oxidoreductase